MTHHPDGAEIPASAEPPGPTPRRAFGWLDADHEFARGSCPDSVVRRLEDAVREPVARTRSWYQCPLCPLTGMGPTKYATAGGEELLLGNATLELSGGDGPPWRAPSLVLHYIDVHDYLPPGQLLAEMEGTAAS